MKLFNIFTVASSLVMASGGLATAIPSPNDKIIVETIVHDDGPTSHSSSLEKPNLNHQVTKGDYQSSAEEMEEWIKDFAKEKDVGGKHGLIQSSPQKSCSFQDSRPVLIFLISYMSGLWQLLSGRPMLQSQQLHCGHSRSRRLVLVDS